MKVYELMEILSKLPSGADIHCYVTLTIDEVKNGENLGSDENGSVLYGISNPLDSVDCCDDRVSLGF